MTNKELIDALEAILCDVPTHNASADEAAQYLRAKCPDADPVDAAGLHVLLRFTADHPTRLRYVHSRTHDGRPWEGFKLVDERASMSELLRREQEAEWARLEREESRA